MFKNSLRNGHCYYSQYVPKSSVTSLLLKDVWKMLCYLCMQCDCVYLMSFLHCTSYHAVSL
jgi:hypothetical protein